MKDSFKVLAFVLAALGARLASALPDITVDGVVQRWPWNNKFDITYTISGDGGQDLAAYGYCKVVFTATIPGRAEPVVIDGSRDIVAKAANGTWTVTWTNAPTGVKAENCLMTASLYRTDGDYMVVDLDSGAYAFDDLADGDTPIATPTASNARYNTQLYKTDRMVFRRIPRTAAAPAAYAGGYPTGHADYAAPTYAGIYTNTPHLWTTDKDYFIGVFEVTQAQYVKMRGSNPSSYKNDVNSPLYPVEKVRYYYDFVANDNANFFPALCGATGLDGFKLPTEVMWEIACRAGVTTTYPWGDGTPSSANCNNYSSSPYKSTTVGSYPSNNWGLFDMIGNVQEYCADGAGVPSDLADTASPWDARPRVSGGAKYMVRGGGWDSTTGAARLKVSYRSACDKNWDQSDSAVGFRAAFIPQ